MVLFLQLQGAPAEAYAEYAHLLSKHRATNRSRKARFVGVEAIVAEVLHKHRRVPHIQKKDLGGARRNDFPSRLNLSNQGATGDSQGDSSSQRSGSGKPKKRR